MLIIDNIIEKLAIVTLWTTHNVFDKGPLQVPRFSVINDRLISCILQHFSLIERPLTPAVNFLDSFHVILEAFGVSIFASLIHFFCEYEFLLLALTLVPALTEHPRWITLKLITFLFGVNDSAKLVDYNECEIISWHVRHLAVIKGSNSDRFTIELLRVSEVCVLKGAITTIISSGDVIVAAHLTLIAVDFTTRSSNTPISVPFATSAHNVDIQVRACLPL